MNILFGFAILSLGISSNVQAVVVTTDSGDGADAHVWIADPTGNYGNSSVVGVKNDDPVGTNNSRKGYIRFDLSTIVDPINSARFELTYVYTDDNAPADPSVFNVFGLNDGTAGENWGESLINWNNAPANDTLSNDGVTGDATFLGTFILSNYGLVPQIVSLASDALVDFIKSDTNNLATLIVTRQEANDSFDAFAAKESVNFAAPALAVNVPEPATLALMSLGLAGMGCRRYRSKKTV